MHWSLKKVLRRNLQNRAAAQGRAGRSIEWKEELEKEMFRREEVEP